MNNWMIEAIEKRQASRNWANLPSQFEQAQVRQLANEFDDHFRYRRDIKTRIKASKATTFAELLKAIR